MLRYVSSAAPPLPFRTRFYSVPCLLIAAVGSLWTLPAKAVDFVRDVRPILANNCLRCHGFDAESREADLRLDDRDSATRPRDEGPVIVPGAPDRSSLIARIESPDEARRMPPPDSKLSLTAAERQVLRDWIAQGAEFAPHWSWLPPRRPPLPEVRQRSWIRNPIDQFVLAKLEAAGRTPSPEADPRTLLRRVTLDLTGLPPSRDDVARWDSAAPEEAYERAVDRLLASPAFGERLAVDWLDAARYADTNGYFGDNPRNMWVYRDWVIRAFNENRPFDRFTIDQLAGDLLPEPTVEQRVATAFNRNHMANNETGIIAEEYRVEYVADRLETTVATWMGLTIGCARCHDHKYDPISQREYYQLFAFFNQVPETGLITTDNPPPLLQVPTAEQTQALKDCRQTVAEADTAFQAFAEPLQRTLAQWEEQQAPQLPPPPTQDLRQQLTWESGAAPLTAVHSIGTTIESIRGVAGQGGKFDATQHLEFASPLNLDQPWTIGVWLRPEGSLSCLWSQVEPTGRRRGIEVMWQKGRFQVHLVNTWGGSAIEVTTRDPVKAGVWHHLVLSYDGSQRASGVSVYVDGHLSGVQVHQDGLRGSLANQEPFRVGRRDAGLGYYGELDELRLLARTVTPAEVEAWFWSERLQGIVRRPAAERTSAEKDVLRDYVLARVADPSIRAAWEKLQAARHQEKSLQEQVPTVLVMEDQKERRPTFVLRRGQYDQPGEPVEPDVPGTLSTWDSREPRNRLGFARWMMAAENPLTARVAVNRYWQLLFGEGLVRTVNDLGTQGEAPTHPELLDWLAISFRESGWDIKRLLRTMVTSATYRQSSAVPRDGVALASRTEPSEVTDVENRLWGRGPRYRLSAETLRDQALAASGLLTWQIGGPGARPYQPPGLWEAVSYNGEETYVADSGAGLWRKSLYTYWKRQAPPPTMLLFDSPTREKCTLRRARTNTPLQALALLNDETYLEASRSLAARVLESKTEDQDRLREAFQRVATREPTRDEVGVLEKLLERQRKRFATQPREAEQLVAVGVAPDGRHVPSPELAAWTVTLQVLFNLDEVITRR